MISDDLLAGYQTFRSHRYAHEEARYREVAKGQTPGTMVIGCADSRVDPATIFTMGPGELFVVRNVAALVPPCEDDGSRHGVSAAIEFAVTALKVQRIVVMGHGLCGGVAASITAADEGPVGTFIGPWVDILSGVRDKLLQVAPRPDPEVLQKALEHDAVKHSLTNLATFPFVAEAVERGDLALEGAWFSIAEGRLEWLDGDVFVEVPVD